MKRIATLIMLIAVAACTNPVGLDTTADSGNHTADSGNATADSGNHTAGSGS